MKRMFLRLTAFVLFTAQIHSLNAQVNKLNVTTTAVPFLRISPDARAGGMGELGIATTPDANSSFYNLAKTPFSQYKTGIAATYTPWLKDLGLNDVYLLSLAGYHKLDELSAITASVRYFSLGTIQFTDYNGNLTSNGRPRELGVDLGYSRKLGDRLSIGLALRYINSNLTAGYTTTGSTAKAGNAVAGDVSLFYNAKNENGQGWSAGLAVTNLGSKIGYTNDASQKEYIPANLGLGGTYTVAFDEQNKLTFGADINKLLVPSAPELTDPTDEQQDSINLVNYHNQSVVSSWFKSFGNGAINFSVGAEYGYNDQFFFRTGYFYEAKSQGGRQYFTLGVGIKYNVVGLNFSYLVPSGSGVTRNPLSNTIRFGLVFDLDGAEKEGD